MPDVQVPINQPEENPSQDANPVASIPVQTAAEEPQPSSETPVNPSHSCPACGGEGLEMRGGVQLDQLCPVCGGDGKEKPVFAFDYPVGTHVLTKEGSFVVSENGSLIKE